MKKKTILITGATGFVGRHLLQKLAEDPEIRTLALVRSRESWEQQDWTRALKGVELIEGSVLDSKAWAQDPRLQGLAGIYHLAAVIRHSRKHPQDMFETNVGGMLEMIRLAAQYHCRLLFLSTSGTVGCFDNPKASADEKAPYCEKTVGSWPYYASKIAAEREGRALAEKLGVELVILRPPILLGPGDHRQRATSHITRLMRGKLPFTVKGGMHFVDIRDVIRAMQRAMELPKIRPVYHLCGHTCSVGEFFKNVADLAGVPPPGRELPTLVAKLLAKASGVLQTIVPGQKHPFLPDPVVFEMGSKYWGLRSRYAKMELGFVPRNPQDTLRDTIAWLRENIPELKEKSEAALVTQAQKG